MIPNDAKGNNYRLFEKLICVPFTMTSATTISLSENKIVTYFEQGQSWSNHYHFLIDNCIRMIDAVEKVPHGLHVLLPEKFREDYRQFLELHFPEITFKRQSSNFVKLPNQTILHSHTPVSKDLVSRFAARVRNQSMPSEQLYLTRSTANVRRALNEDDVLNLLARFGFRSVDLSRYSISRQQQLMQNTRIVVSVHGAGLANIVFMRQGSQIIELSPCQQDFHENHYEKLSSFLDHSYHVIYHDKKHKNSDFNVDLRELEASIKDVISLK